MKTRSLATALAAALALAGCPGGGGKPGQKRDGGGPIAVRVLEAQSEPVEQVLELTGTLGAEEESPVSAEVEGRVEKVLADLGDQVKAGAPIVQLAATELRLHAEQAEADYLQALAKLGVDEAGLERFDPAAHTAVRKALADLEEARRNLARGEEVMRRGLMAQGELDQLQTRLRIAEATHQASLEEARSAFATARSRKAAAGLARKKLQDATVRSPVDGVVASRLVSPGEYVRAGQTVAVVVVTDPLKLRGQAPERYAAVVKPGMAVEVAVDIPGGAEHAGSLSRVGPAVAVSSRTFPVEALVRNEAGLLKPGLFARARIRLGDVEQVIAVPETAISSVAGVTKVFVAEDGKARERKVQVLRKRGSDALLVGELKPGERVILTGIARMHDGASVLIEGDKPAVGDRG
ncbi:MAG: efflux RND transporter periplasmic adaptor subunit [Myxococcales bacterium]|jgi:RND family efflux transporter MFP subunit